MRNLLRFTSRGAALVGVTLATGLARQARADPPLTGTQPPSIVSLPEIEAPEGTQAASVELVIVVGIDGHASVEACEGTDELCALGRTAIAQAVFQPATRDGTPVAARIRVRLAALARAPEPPVAVEPAAEPTAEIPVPEPPPDAMPPESDADNEPTFVARAVANRPPAGTRRLEVVEMREMPGAFGDPFRAIEALPGVTPIMSVVPYFYIRGAPPAGTLYIYDEIPIPLLFHFAMGPSVVHAAMLGPVRLYSAAPPARFGRFIGGVIEGEGPPELGRETHGDAEIRLVDASGMVQTPLGDGVIAASGRYGWPGAVVSLFAPGVWLAYWDYQLRGRYPASRHSEFELVWLGSMDQMSITSIDDNGNERLESATDIQFHRLELRHVLRRNSVEFGTAVRLGYEISSMGSGDPNESVAIWAFTVGPRLWLSTRGDGWKGRVGVELLAATGDIDVPGGEDLTPEGGSGNDPMLQSLSGRLMAATYAEVALKPAERLTVDLGLRADSWIVNAGAQSALDPRLRLTYQATPTLELHLAGGLAHQPAVFMIPLPALSDIAVNRGLQSAVQTDVGASVELAEDITADGQFFYHHYTDLMMPDFFLFEQASVNNCGPDADEYCGEVEFDSRMSGYAYGAEVFVRREPEARISGFLSYTLAWAGLEEIQGLDYSPSYDVRHVLNLAGQWNIGSGFSAGMRLHARSGKPLGEFYWDAARDRLAWYEQRLPWFARLDAQITYAWTTHWGRMRVKLEWLNATLAKEPLGLDCYEGRPCEVQYPDFAIFVPMLGFRGEF